MGRAEVFLTTAGDIHLARKVLDATDRFASAPGEDTLQELNSRSEAIPLFA